METPSREQHEKHMENLLQTSYENGREKSVKDRKAKSKRKKIFLALFVGCVLLLIVMSIFSIYAFVQLNRMREMTTSLMKHMPAYGVENQTFRAAVYEHAVIFSADINKANRSVALANMMKNINVYKEQAIEAGKQKANILVFPEYGIYGGLGLTRSGIESFLEYIPDPKKETWNPCSEPCRYNNTDIQNALSCMARENNLYIVANMGDIQPCCNKSDPKCPDDGHYQFNTDVVYNSDGVLIAKYHKINLYFEHMFDTPPGFNNIYFDTPFGRFGVMTCFDILFRNPIVDLLEVHGIGHVVFPTAWMDSLPLLAAIQFHSGFAAGANVNFLAANIKFSDRRFHGSGIYTPKGFASFFYSEDQTSKLLVSDIPIIRHRRIGNIPKRMPRMQKLFDEHANMKQTYLTSKVFHDTYNMRILEGLEGTITGCQNALCCQLSFKRNTTGELFALGVRDGLHPRHGPYYLQVCTLLRCRNNSESSCGTWTKESQTSFQYVNIKGTFTTRYIYPEILLFDGKLISLSAPSQWTHADGELESSNGFEFPLISANMIGRAYDHDCR